MNFIDIQCHGRESLGLPYSVIPDPTTSDQFDISASALYLEIFDLGVRKALALDPENPLGRKLVLSLAEVATLPEVPVGYLVRNDTEERIEFEGTIVRIGYVGEPA